MDRFSEILTQLEARRDEPNRHESFGRFKQALLSCHYKFNPARIVAIAGTNGKGSTAKALQTFLSSQGLKVGLFTSPHLIETTERIRLDGIPISRETFIKTYENLREVIETSQLSHFEALTLMACEVFFGAENSVGTGDSTGDGAKDGAGAALGCVDWAIFEVGVGGLLDPVKAIPHATSVITRLGMDHQKILGETLVEIARHKFGIVNEGNRVFHLPFDEALGLLTLPRNGQAQGRWQLCESFPYRIESEAGEPVTILQTPWGDARLDLPGPRGAENVSLALQIFAGLGFDPEAVLENCAKINWPGRMERIRPEQGSIKYPEQWPCPVYLSGDHNPQGIESLKRLLDDYDYESLHIIVGIAAGKETSQMLSILSSIPRAKLYLTQTSFRPQPMREAYSEWLTKCEFHSADPQACFTKALLNATPEDRIIVTGSLYLVGAFRATLGCAP